ncbi:hypothetical protein FACS1894219_10440 [Clostridia bacterium]|nr:hypothetical protein FACS1894219_10440 [Clostridia bacterium]
MKYAQIGDNWQSDFENAGKFGFRAVHYINVNHTGNYYRTYNISAIVGAAWRGLVNARLHAGLAKYSKWYEYGFTCGGLFVLGYCNFIRNFVCENNIDKVLFLARDGEILMRVYEKYFGGNTSFEYAYWSRNAALKSGSDRYRRDFFRRYVYHKVNSETSLAKIFSAMELEDLSHGFYKSCKLTENAVLTAETGDKLVKYLVTNWVKVQKIYAPEREYAGKYYANLVRNCKRVCTVDVGWAGSGGAILDYLAREVWRFDCEFYTLVAGTNTGNNYEPDMSESLLQSGRMNAYLYSQRHNRDLYYAHNPGLRHNIYFEMLLSSKSASLRGFKSDSLVFAKDTEDSNDILIDEIQRGILDFCGDYCGKFSKYKYMREISGADAYAPFRHLTGFRDEYFRKLFAGLRFDIGVGEERKLIFGGD